MDRFNSNEDIELSTNSQEFKEGVEARKSGKSNTENPYKFNISTTITDQGKIALWNAGWADQDMIYNSEKCPKCHGELDVRLNFKQCHDCQSAWPIKYLF